MPAKSSATPTPARIIEFPSLPARPESGHKGLFGRVLIVGGSDSMIGAPVLAGTAALRCGAGLVQIALPKDVLPAALSITPELIGLALGRNDDELLEAASHADAIVAGPGLGKAPGAKKRVKHLIRLEKLMVLDADALNILAAEDQWPAKFRAQAVLTPHPGEMKRLAKLLGRSEVPSDEAGRIELATAAAIAFGQIVVLKGHHTVIADGKRVFVNRSGDSSLSKAGTGDVLSGILGTFLAQKMDRFDAACAAAHIHGRAGEIAGNQLGRRCVLARDVIEALPESIREYEKNVG